MDEDERKYTGRKLAELDALHAAATPGPWIAVGPEGDEKATDIVAEDSVYGVPVCELATAGIIESWEPLERNRESIDADARLIAAACNALPHLTARVRELEADLKRSDDDLRDVAKLYNEATICAENRRVRIAELEAQLAAAREDTDRLDWLIDQDSDGLPEEGGMLSDALWDSASELCPIDSGEADDTRKWMRLAIDSARGAK